MNKPTVTVAKSAGFCFGVRRAVEMVFGALEQGEQVCTLGPIIHNPQVIAELEQRGAVVIDTPEQNTDGRRVVIRSHGVEQSVYDRLAELGMDYVDATCPYVAKIHRLVADIGPDDLAIVAGDAGHPEVQGIVGHCAGEIMVIDCADCLFQVPAAVFESKNRVIVLTQTTFDMAEWRKCTDAAKKVCTKARIFDTICNATSLRQQEAQELAQVCDCMVVVGGRQSANTARLAELCRRICETVSVETAQELRGFNLAGHSKVGITAGASTPDRIIKEVHETMSEMLENQNQTEELSFEEMLEQSLKSTYTGEKVTGVVTSIAPNEIAVDIGTKHAGYVPLAELTDDPAAKPEDLVKKGDELELLVVRVNDVEGTVMLSKKRLDAQAGFEKVMSAVDSDEILEGVVTEVIKGGVLALTNGVKVFIPASQATLSRGENLENLLRKTVRFKILEVNRQRRRAVGSIRAVLREARKGIEDQFWNEVEVGKHYKGVVKSLTDYGAFIDLGGVDGMAHISELSWGKVRHPSQVVSVGDEIEVYVKDIDPEKRKISLGYKKDDDNPWNILKASYQVGQKAHVKVVSLTTFGAFAELLPGVDGLIHISQMSRERVGKPSDVLSVGQEVDVLITELDFDRQRISLSIRSLLEEEGGEEPTSAAAFAEEAPVEESAPAAEETPADAE